MAYGSFEDLEVWKRGCRLAVRIYEVLKSCRDYGFKDQITRAAVPIPSNIAEGAERGSKAEFIRFLHILNLAVLRFHKCLESIIIDLFVSSFRRRPEIQVDSRSWFFWMPDQVLHDGELWTVEIS